MSYPAKHVLLLEEAYRLLTPSLESRYFPDLKQIKRHEGPWGPDTFHAFKLLTGIRGYRKFNHMNGKLFSGALSMSEKYYHQLVRKLKTGKGGGREAAWLAHFVADATEPAHLYDWRTGKGQKEKLKKHLQLEKLTEKVRHNRRQNLKITKIPEPVRNYLISLGKDIRALNLPDLLDSGRLMPAYESQVVPRQIQAIASVWFKAVEESLI